MNQVLEAQAYTELLQLYAEYTAAIDAGDWDRWPEFFTEDCIYKLQPRENHERGLPLATLHFHSKGMLQDRVYGIRETLFHDPYYQRHVVSLPRVLSVDGGRWFLEANYAVFRTKLGELSTVFNVGRYLDEVVRVEGALKFASRSCIYDSEMIPNAIIYPIQEIHDRCAPDHRADRLTPAGTPAVRSCDAVRSGGPARRLRYPGHRLRRARDY